VFRIVHLETWDVPEGPGSGSVVDPTAELDRLAAALSAVEMLDIPSPAGQPLRLFEPGGDSFDDAEEQPRVGLPEPLARLMADEPARGGVAKGQSERLPENRVRFAQRRQLAGDQALGRVAELEANLERLVAELEAEVDRLEDASSLAVQDQSPPTCA
jgi:hypothetical protein